MRKSVFILLMSCITAFAAPKVKTVECEYTYYPPDNVSLEQAKAIALERAQIQAIAEEFGTNVSQTNISHVVNVNKGEGEAESRSDIQSLGMSEVKGEWIETIGEPVYDVAYADGMLMIKVRVKGKARELAAATVDCRAYLLRNGMTERDRAERFVDGDQIYLSFQSTANGYLTVYLSDGDGTVSCLLPYPSQADANFPVKANKRHMLFDGGSGDEFTEEYYLTASRPVENNMVYVIFSPQPYTKALDSEASGELLPRELPEPEFQKWLAKCRRRDPEMQLIRLPITIASRP